MTTVERTQRKHHGSNTLSLHHTHYICLCFCVLFECVNTTTDCLGHVQHFESKQAGHVQHFESKQAGHVQHFESKQAGHVQHFESKQAGHVQNILKASKQGMCNILKVSKQGLTIYSAGEYNHRLVRACATF